jgi:hypothetical protein
MAVTSAAWQSATAAQPTLAAQVNQFLGIHASQIIYTGVTTSSQTTPGATSTSTNGLWLAQSFSTAGGQTAIGILFNAISTATTSGASLAPTTLSLYANAAGAPTGGALMSVTITAEYANLATGATATNSAIYPLPITGLTASTTYWLVLAAAGNVSNSYTWYRSNQVSGASTSPNGSTWTAQGYGFVYQVADQTAVGLQNATWEDGGARWTATRHGAGNLNSAYGEYTAGQTAAGYTQSYRNLTYSGSLLTNVT